MLGIVLAAGEGARMAPLTPERPKALLPTFDTTQLSWTLSALAQAGVDRVWVNADTSEDLIEEAVGRERGLRAVTISVFLEKPHALGSAGILRALAGETTETFVVAATSIAHDLPIQRLIQAHNSARAAGTILTRPAEEHGEFLLEESWVVDLIGPHEVLAGSRYAGLGIFEPEVLEHIPEAAIDAGPAGLEETVIPALVARRTLAALEWDGYWRELVTPGDHLMTNLDVLSGKRDPTVLAAATAAAKQSCERWDSTAYVGASSSVEDVELRHCVVGANASIAPGARLERCVVWDGAHVPRGDYRDSIVTRTRVVPVK
jgi:NDP-sugar pyrophosphorylase family protein